MGVLSDWVKLQPNDRPVKMDESINEPDTCGCLMVQYYRLFDERRFVCTCEDIHYRMHILIVLPREDKLLICKALVRQITTFGEAKEIIKELEE